MIILHAMSRVNYIILKPINGQTHRIILTLRKFAKNVLTVSVRQVFLNQAKFAKLLRQRITRYAVASTDNAAFIIGGTYSPTNIIAKFQDNQWTRYGSLKASRRLNGSIQSGDLTMIIGGDSSV